MTTERSVTLTPSWLRVYLRPAVYAVFILWGAFLLMNHLILRLGASDPWQITLGALLVFFGLMKTVSHIRSVHGRTYLFTDQYILFQHQGDRERLELADIESIEIERLIPERWLGLGDMILNSKKVSYVIIGQKNPEDLKMMLETAIDAEQKRIRSRQTAKPASHIQEAPGTLDRLDTLTGLWQQGLISEQDFRDEQKHFKS